MMLEKLIAKIENVSKSEVKRVAPKNCREINDIIKGSYPRSLYEKMLLGYLTTLCAENMYPMPFSLGTNGLDYVGFELEKGTIEVDIAGNNLGSCMRSGKIIVKKAGEETGSSMGGGEIVADEIKSIGNTIGGRITAKKVGKISNNQGAELIIKGKKYRRGILDNLLGR